MKIIKWIHAFCDYTLAGAMWTFLIISTFFIFLTFAAFNCGFFFIKYMVPIIIAVVLIYLIIIHCGATAHLPKLTN